MHPLQRRHDPALPVAATSQSSIRRPVDEPPPKPVLVFLHSDAARDLKTQTCLQCGINHAGPPVRRAFQYVPPWVYLGLLVNLVVLIILYAVGRKRLDANLYLCPDCTRADARGRRLRGFSVVSLLAFPTLGALLGGLILDDAAWALGMGSAGLVAGIASVVAATTRTKHEVIDCKNIDTRAQTITLLAAPTWQTVLEREARDALATTPR